MRARRAVAALSLLAMACLPPEVDSGPLADPSPDKGAQGTIVLAVPDEHDELAEAMRGGFASRNPAARLRLVAAGSPADAVLEAGGGTASVQVAPDAANPAGAQAFAAFVDSPDGRLLAQRGS